MQQVPLFPLNTVLFPGGALPLRIFEARYMDMVRDCLRDDLPFGVALITRGSEVGQPAQTEAIGCLASISAWDMQQLGVLHIRTRGTQRFRIHSATAQGDGLLRGEIELIEPDQDVAIAPEHRPCVDLLARVIDDMARQLAEKRAAADLSDVLGGMPFEQPYQLESSAWVGNRLCEVLPVPVKAKQKLMELEDARMRLEIVSQYLRQHAILK
jgi:hypothetical protein